MLNGCQQAARRTADSSPDTRRRQGHRFLCAGENEGTPRVRLRLRVNVHIEEVRDIEEEGLPKLRPHSPCDDRPTRGMALSGPGRLPLE